jgi:hypothetical protein
VDGGAGFEEAGEGFHFGEWLISFYYMFGIVMTFY